MPILKPVEQISITSVGRLFVPNPDDGTTTYTQVEISSSANDVAYTAIATVNIVSKDERTSVVDPAGAATTYYKYRYKTASGSFSPYSPSIQAGNSVIRNWCKVDITDITVTDTMWDQWIFQSIQDLSISQVYGMSEIQDVTPTSTTDYWKDLANDIKVVTRVDLYTGSSYISSTDAWEQRGRKIRLFFPDSTLTYKVSGLSEIRNFSQMSDEMFMLVYWMVRVRYIDKKLAERTDFKYWIVSDKTSDVSTSDLKQLRDQAQQEVNIRIMSLRPQVSLPAGTL